MTPLAGFIAAIVAGWLIRDPRRATAAIVVPFLAVLAVQSWGIAAGYDHSPPSTITSFPGTLGYWLVQLIILAPALVIAAELGALRARSARAHGVVTSPRRAVVVSVLLTLAAGVFAAVYAAQVSPITDHLANGAPPVYGFAGMGLLFVTLVVLSVLLLWVRRTARRQAVTGAQSSVVPMAGRR
ncbi:MAG TPA: hypothetical protein VGH27_17925 [Streptosporangiaceae bacterium]|jgi:hypothetical protein